VHLVHLGVASQRTHQRMLTGTGSGDQDDHKERA
jgi:hypothetical protein